MSKYVIIIIDLYYNKLWYFLFVKIGGNKYE